MVPQVRYQCSIQRPKTLHIVQHTKAFFSRFQAMLIGTLHDKRMVPIWASTQTQTYYGNTLCTDSKPSTQNPVVQWPWLRQRTVPSNQFQALLTPVSEFFSTFAHATCSLTVSLWYLALREIYHAFNGAIPSSATLQYENIWQVITQKLTGLSPFLALISIKLYFSNHPTEFASQNYNSSVHYKTPDFKFELFPVRSPLLRESLLFSFPPINNMLKFMG